jgi:hypothetical protein
MKSLVNGREGSIGAKVYNYSSKKSFEITRLDNFYIRKFCILTKYSECITFAAKAFIDQNIAFVI